MTSDETVSVDGEIVSDTANNYRNENNNNREEGNCNKSNQCDCDQNFSTNQENKCDNITFGSDNETSDEIIREILGHIFDDVCNFGEAHRKANRENNVPQNDEEKALEITQATKVLHRKTRIFVDSSEVNQEENLNIAANKRESLYSLEEHDEEPEEPVVLRHKKTKTTQAVNNKLITRHKSEIPIRERNPLTKSSSTSSIFGSVFRRKPKKDSEGPECISEPKHKKQSQEVGSATNIKSGTSLTRTPSLRKKLSNFLNKDAPSLLKRSFSFKDLSKRREKEKSREKLSEMKNLEWASSLQSLVETDIGISYKDLSFVNYDFQNEISYNKKTVQRAAPVRILQRAQSLHENGSTPINRKPNLLRGTSFPRHYQSTTDLSDSGALSLPSLHHLQRENVEIPSENLNRSQKYRRRPPSICSEDGGKSRPIGNGSFKSAGSGCAKLKRHNACRQKTRDSNNSIHGDPRHSQEGESILFGIGKNSKIARESLNAEDRTSPSPEGQQYEWRKLVGSIRRRVQRHASTSGAAEATSGGGAATTPIRKNSLTRNKFDVFKWDKSKEEGSNPAILEKGKKERKSSLDKFETKEVQKFLPLTKQKSVGPETANSDNFKALSFKDKQKSSSVKNIDCLISPKLSKRSFILNKGVRKSDQSSEKMQKNSSFRGSAEHEKKGISRIYQKLREDKNVSRDDFLKATMRIFLVVSPPVGKMQVRSKSLNHLDEIEMRQSAEPPADSGLKDSKSEPDCARTLLAPPVRTIPTPEPSITSAVDPAVDPPARKHVLTRSQKSSSECFSVNFEVGDESTWDNELFFPAVRGITLNDSLSKLCELRNIDLTSCDAWLQDKSSNTNAWLPFSQDTACLAGKHVRITAKDVASNKKHSISTFGSHSRKPSTSNSKSRTGSFFSSSIEDGSVSLSTNISQDNRLSLQDSDASKKQPKQRWSGFFSNTKDTKMELLVEQLNSYAKNGIPNCQIYPQGQCESIDALYKLEGDWRELIDCSDLTERLQQQQTALWELIKTEVAYIKTLKVVTDLFLACLKNLQSVNLLKEIDTEKLFSNITEILDANVLFWRNCIFPLVRDMRRYKQPPCIENMLQGFLKISDTFQAYFRYCAEQARCQHYCRENHTHNELFTAYLAWCETQKECNRLRLMDILVQPMQRLTKYGLLLKAILRNTDDDVEKDNLNLMIKSVDEFVNNVNFSLKQKQDNERLKGIMARIESYDVVESKDDDLEKLLKSYSQLDLNKPMVGCPPERKRHLLLEGDLKLKDSSTSKMEVHCFLLTDMLLVCKPSTKKGGATMRIVRQPYLIDRLVITELTRETPSLAVIYKNEFDLPVAAFILQNNDSKKLKGWKESITKAQLLYQQAKQMNYPAEESLESDYTTEYNLEGDYHSLQLMPRSPLASSSRASRVSSLAHSHSGSVEMNDQSSIGSANQSRAVSMENENRTASISSDEGVQPLPPDKSPVSQKLSFKHRLFNKTPNTLSVQPYGSLGQSLPNLTLGSPNVGTLSLNLSQNTLSVPNSKTGTHLLSPTHRGVSYPPPSPTRGNLKRGLAISQNKNPPLLKTRHVTSTIGPTTTSQQPTSFDFDVPVIAGVSSADDSRETFSRGQHRQAMLKRIRNDNKRYHTAGVVDDIKHNDTKDPSIHKRLSWTCSPQASEVEPEDPT